MLTNKQKEDPTMEIINLFQTLSALSGIAIIAFGSLWLKQFLKRSFCCPNIS